MHSKPKVLIGITGSIAGYKAVNLVNLLKSEFEVKVVMTEAATRIFDRLDLEQKIEQQIYVDLFEQKTEVDDFLWRVGEGLEADAEVTKSSESGDNKEDKQILGKKQEAKTQEGFLNQDSKFKNIDYRSYLNNQRSIPHIELADWADLVLVCPATATTIGKLANGIYDNLLTNIISATKAPVLICPAMNVKMWQNPIVQDNVSKLKIFGYGFLGPESGNLACGYTGQGRLVSPGLAKQWIKDYFKLKEQKISEEVKQKEVEVVVSRNKSRIDFDLVSLSGRRPKTKNEVFSNQLKVLDKIGKSYNSVQKTDLEERSLLFLSGFAQNNVKQTQTNSNKNLQTEISKKTLKNDIEAFSKETKKILETISVQKELSLYKFLESEKLEEKNLKKTTVPCGINDAFFADQNLEKIEPIESLTKEHFEQKKASVFGLVDSDLSVSETSQDRQLTLIKKEIKKENLENPSGVLKAVNRDFEEAKQDRQKGFISAEVFDHKSQKLSEGSSGINNFFDPHSSQKNNITEELVLGTKKNFAYLKANKQLEILVTAGGTTEHIDSARVISNKSTGKMGLAMTKAFMDKGYGVRLLAASTIDSGVYKKFLGYEKEEINNQKNLEVIEFSSYEDLFIQMEYYTKLSKAICQVAAVSDFSIEPFEEKISSSHSLNLNLKPTEKILNKIKVWNPDCYLISFKAEQSLDKLIQKSQANLFSSKSDVVVGNLINQPNSGFGVDTNEVWVFTEKGKYTKLITKSKLVIAKEILEVIKFEI